MPSKGPSKDKRLSWSRVETFHLCPQKYAYRYEEELVPIDGEFDSALAFGQALHKALETIYNGTAFQVVHCPCEDTCTFCERLLFVDGPRDGFYQGRWMYRVLAQFLLYYPQDPDPETDSKNPRTRERGVALLHAYLEHWKREAFEVVAVEQEFEIPFYSDTCSAGVNDPDLEFTYVGVIDLLARESGVLKPWDHKGKRWFGDQFETEFKLSPQVTGYIEGTSQATGEQVTSGWINGIKTSGPIGDDSFKRLETYRFPEDIERWYNEVRETWALIKRYREMGWWPRHAPFSCYAYNRRCAYYNLCASGAADAAEKKLTAYMKVPPRFEEDIS